MLARVSGGAGMDSEDMFVEAEKGEIADDAALGEGELGPAHLVEQ